MSIDTNPNGHDPNELRDEQYFLADDGGWFIVKDFNIRILSTDEGVIVDVHVLDREDEGVIATTYAFDNECEVSQ